MLTVKRMIPIYVLALLVVALVIVSCDEDTPADWEDPLLKARLSVSDATVAFYSNADTSAAIRVTNVGNDAALQWKVQTTALWLSFNSLSGVTPNDSLMIRCETNDSAVARSATVTVTATDLPADRGRLTITVTQSEEGPVLCVSETEWVAGVDSSESPYIMVTNCGTSQVIEWGADVDAEWLTLTSEGGSTPDSFTIVAEANETGFKREPAYVIVSSAVADGSPDTIVVTQPTSGPVLCISDTVWEADAFGQDTLDVDTVEIEITNCGNETVLDWTVDDDADWLHQSDASGTTTGSFTMWADTNNTGAERTATVTVTAAGATSSPKTIEVTQPAVISPVSLGYPSVSTQDVFVFGGYVYVADQDEGLLIFAMDSISEETQFDPVATFATAGPAVAVHVHGSIAGGYAFAYVAEGADGVQIVDVSDPETPALLGTIVTDGTANDVYVRAGDTAYVASTSGLEIYDVYDPEDIVEVAIEPTGGQALGIHVAGHYIVGDPGNGSYAYIADGDNGIVVMNIGTAGDPDLAGDWDDAGINFNSVFVVRGEEDAVTVYTTDPSDGLYIIDATDPTDPTPIGEQYATGGPAMNVRIFPGVDFVDDGEGNWEEVETTLAFISDGAPGGLVVVDVTDPDNLLLVGSYVTDGEAWASYAAGGYVFVADGTNGLVVLQLAF